VKFNFRRGSLLGVMAPEKLMGRDGDGGHAEQVYSGVSFDLLNLRKMLCRLKVEVDVGLRKVELAIKYVWLSELGLGVKAPSAA
jgi:hypothetical protein